jgi:hypothetical protein
LWTPPQAPKLGAKNYEKKQARYTSLEAEALEWLGPLAARRIELREDIGRIGESSGSGSSNTD